MFVCLFVVDDDDDGWGVSVRGICARRTLFLFVMQQLEDLDRSYADQKSDLASLQERLDDLARERYRIAMTSFQCDSFEFPPESEK